MIKDITHFFSKNNPFKNSKLDFSSVSKTGIKSLYRFTYFDNERYYEDLLKNILFFPSRSQLNDPFDAQIPTRYDLCNEKELDKHLEELLKKKGENPNNFNQMKAKAKERLEQDSPSYENMDDEFIEKTVGILSLTEDINSLLLWAHYTSKHTGFCVELNAQILNTIIDSEFNINKDLAFIFKVKYRKRFPIINPCRHSIEQRMQLQFLTKSEDWKYEKEWRILLLNGSKQKRELPVGVINNIYFGLNTRAEDIRHCKELLQQYNSNIGFFKAHKKNNTFGLEFKELV